ncbi:MAG: nicotinamide mononucleotide transporter [Bacteroidetes bacterium CG2_30_33_31]|nr:MAG: nicotinamide mononucleotide transporter [Bacteroidetes bacterium CG2_30_33_31]
MEEFFGFFLDPYNEAKWYNILLEFVAAAFGVLSVVFAKKENIWVYPTGIISTLLYVYLLYRWQLYGDLIINIYYTFMSIYGWYMWSKIIDSKQIHLKISKSSKSDYIKSTAIFIFTSIFVIIVYRHFAIMPIEMDFSASINYFWEHFTSGKLLEFKKITPYLDTFTTGAAFSAMWLMANKKLESWIFWISVNIVSVPLYFVKGYGFTGIQYIIFLILAVFGYISWKKSLKHLRD